MRTKKKFIVIGVTGSIGMGKSTVSRLFEKEGFAVFDADIAVHEVFAEGGDIFKKIEKMFPEAIEAGKIDRKKIANIIFHDDKKREELERILHPSVWKKMKIAQDQARDAQKKGIILDVPLLFETKADQKCDIIVCVSASLKKQKARVMHRRGMTRAKFEKINKAQMSDAEKRKRAHYVVKTDVRLSETRAQVLQILNELL